MLIYYLRATASGGFMKRIIKLGTVVAMHTVRTSWRRRLTVGISLAAATVLFLPGTARASVSAPIDSVYGWQFSNAYFSVGDVFTVSTNSPGPDGAAGKWTVDYR